MRHLKKLKDYHLTRYLAIGTETLTLMAPSMPIDCTSLLFHCICTFKPGANGIYDVSNFSYVDMSRLPQTQKPMKVSQAG